MSIKELYELAIEMKIQDWDICQVLHTKSGLEIKLKEKENAKYESRIITIKGFENRGD